MVRGRCQIIEGAEAVRAAFAGMAEARGAGPARASGSTDSAPKRVVLKIIPERVTSWDHSKLGGKYYGPGVQSTAPASSAASRRSASPVAP
jgi:hypothetical protein